ncbi:alpha-L-rhamnosidase [Sphingobacterium bovistauri]|uniref:alpha-L-rhamnosidase n=1 Tax=Sphingobacterium bovistauri TaxID=2781959 RepID=A0ABS7Z7M4_9SPHI|nr:alpha-L-rhamnosidase [Sphingobacterium bovistauri]MCA5004709.1 family 78 glycoside hydrolase catalytic domain [Sphingobacterium bovistauri]
MKLKIGIIWIILCNVFIAKSQSITVHDLRCELIENPISIDIENPRLSWKILGQQRGVVQESYHVLVASSLELLNRNIGDLWDSKNISSRNSISVYYAGEKLRSRKQVFWKVKIKTNFGESGWSEPANWTVGLLIYKDWYNRWIGFDGYLSSDNQTEGKLAARYFRKEFQTSKKVKKAVAYIMGLGLYEMYINGNKIGDQVLAPTPTDYSQNIKYNAFDVTSNLQQGDNAIGVVLGNGRFYAMRQSKPYKVKSFGFPKMQMQIFVTYEDGSTQVIRSDDSWKGTTDGPITANNEYDGEEYDARKELVGWTRVGYDDSKWSKALYVQQPSGKYEAQINSFMKVMQDIKPVQIIQKEKGRFIVDFGQNFSGWVKFKVTGNAGEQVKLKFAESLQDNGELFLDNLRDAKSTDTYILKGGSVEEWEPTFTYHGFRYVEFTNYSGLVDPKNFVGRFVYDDLATIGSFQSSNSILNKIYQNAWWGTASNYKGMPIDCPQRNERQPWLGDRTVTAYGESFMFDNLNFYNKWLEDIRLSQTADGSISDVAPAFWRYYSDNISWPGTYLVVADMLYEQSNDLRILSHHYSAMRKWMNYMYSNYTNEKGIISKDSYGDWCFPPESIEAGRGKIADKKYPSPLISTAYYYHLLGLMEKFSKLTGNHQDTQNFSARAEKIKNAFNSVFYNEKGFYGDNKLTENILAVNFGLVEAKNRGSVINNMINTIKVVHSGHLSTGVVGVQWLMRTLTDIGQADLAYELATKKTYPSWGYMIENGATTIWELWNGNSAHPKMNSQNHVMMLGDLMVWYYENLAGIKSKENAFQTIEMKPELVGDLNFVNATYQSLYGQIDSKWKKTKNDFQWEIAIPVNATAVIYIPTSSVASIYESGKSLKDAKGLKVLEDVKEGRVKVEVVSGNYLFKSKI